VKPIPNYQVYKGDVFQLITQAVSFVLSNITVSTGARDKGVEVDVNYELPVRAVTEAIVNAVCHRDYTSNASVQVMLFKDRLEIWNPGHLPFGMTIAKLKQKHNSIPVNPLIAEPLYLAGTIERMGTGTEEIIDKCKQAGLKEPEFVEEESFTTTLWRNVPVEDTVTPQVTPQVGELVDVLEGDMNRQEIQSVLNLLDRKYFRLNYLKLALEQDIIEMTIPDKPNSRLQKYRLTQKGIALKNNLQEIQ
jgi:predicted HTH transcriptional regulator